MRVKNSSRYDTEELNELIKFATKGIRLTNVGIRVSDTYKPFAGRAYRGVPQRSGFYGMKTVSYVIGLKIGHPKCFPFTDIRSTKKSNGEVVAHGYGSVRSPIYTMRNWQECVVALAAHEAKHIEQFSRKKTVSEYDCEVFALKKLTEYRAKGGVL